MVELMRDISLDRPFRQVQLIGNLTGKQVRIYSRDVVTENFQPSLSIPHPIANNIAPKKIIKMPTSCLKVYRDSMSFITSLDKLTECFYKTLFRNFPKSPGRQQAIP